MAWLPSLLRVTSTPKTLEKMQPEDARHDDDWTDVLIEGPNALTDSLLLNMPSLFSKDLPPCGLHAQVAYENINNQLRKYWLQEAAMPHLKPTEFSILDLCTLIKDDIEGEADLAPPGTRRATKTRDPWRSEQVFRYELGWAQYFVEEAKVLEKWPTMTEAEKDRQRFLFRLYPIPTCLQIYVKNIALKSGILDMWAAWHEGKRADLRELTEQVDAADGEDDVEEEVASVQSEGLLKGEQGQKELKDKIAAEKHAGVKVDGNENAEEGVIDVQSEKPSNGERQGEKEQQDKTVVEEEAPERGDLGLHG